MRSLLAVVVFGACTHPQPPPPSNVARAVIAEPEIAIDPDSAELRSKRRYWKKGARAYMSQVPGPVCICENVPALTYDSPTGPQTAYMTRCSTYH